MRTLRWANLIGAGLLAGLLGTLTMALVMVAARYWLGISPPPEASPDRFAPTLDIPTFFGLFDRYGGYNGLKKFGIRSGMLGLLAVGTLVGAVYAVVVERDRGRGRDWPGGVSPWGVRFVAVAALTLWVATLILLAPVLDANYRGLAPSRATVASALGLLAAYAAYGAVLIVAYRFLTRTVTVAAGTDTTARPAQVGQALDRRALVGGVIGAALIWPSFALLRRLYDRATFSYDGTRPPAIGLQGITPNDQFYVVTKNVVDPQVTKAVWALEVDGHVDEARRYGFDDLAALPNAEVEATLSCISNAIGDLLMSNAVWTGVPMRDLLAAAGVKDGAVEVVLHGADAYSDTFSIEKAMEPTTLVAYRMNGEAIPDRHGYPVRVVVPGLFGEKNVKWVTRIEVVDYNAKGFYEQQGWGPTFVVPTRASQHDPDLRRDVKVGTEIVLKGNAFAGDRGISRVEISLDDAKTWQPATIDYPSTGRSWALWSHPWTPTRVGEVAIVVRAADGTCTLQPNEPRGIIPDGAAGYHRRVAKVVA